MLSPFAHGFGERCDVRATDVRLDWPEGTRFRARLVDDDGTVSVGFTDNGWKLRFGIKK